MKQRFLFLGTATTLRSDCEILRNSFKRADEVPIKNITNFNRGHRNAWQVVGANLFSSISSIPYITVARPEYRRKPTAILYTE